jgi:hypothetical protein
MVEEMNVHQFTGSFDAQRQVFILTAGRKVSGGMVVAGSENGAIGHDGLANDNTNIDSCLCDASM